MMGTGRGYEHGYGAPSPRAAIALERLGDDRIIAASRRGGGEMTKSDLIERIAHKQPQLAYRDVELAVKAIIEHMAERLAGGDRIEIRGFGSFSLHHRPARTGRNPKTGAPVLLPAKSVPHFKPGKELRDRVDRAYQSSLDAKQPDGAAAPQAPSPAYEHGYTSSSGTSPGDV